MAWSAPPAPSLGPWVELVVVVALAFAAAYLVQWFVVKPYRIPSESMENTLMVGDRVLVARFWYRFSDPERGQIIVFHPPGRGDEVIDKATTPGERPELHQARGRAARRVGRRLPAADLDLPDASRRDGRRPTAGVQGAQRAVHVLGAAAVRVPAGPAGPLLRDGRQPRQLRRLAGHRHDPARAGSSAARS